MREFPASTREVYLSGLVEPEVTATVRQIRLDFGAAPFSYNTAGQVGGTLDDGGHDLPGNRILWGDSCIEQSSPYGVIRLAAAATWNIAGSQQMYRSYATPAVDVWTYTDLTGPDLLFGYSRPGIHGILGGNGAYVWYMDSAQNLRRVRLTSTWTWSGKSSGYELEGFTASAVHPVSPTECVVVTYTDPYLSVQYLKYDGTWTAHARHKVHSSDLMTWSDAHWSDAELNPSDQNEIIVTLNLSRWGSLAYIVYDIAAGIWSQPREVLPSQEQWGNLRVWGSGLSTVNDRLWLVTMREPVTSSDAPQANHVALMSSLDGRHWLDESFVTISDNRGKLCYIPGKTYAHVAGCATVHRAKATNRLGHDASDLKHEIPLYSFSCLDSGPGSSPEITASIVLEEGDPDYLALAEAENEIEISIGSEGQPPSVIRRGLLSRPLRSREVGSDTIEFKGLGYMARALGGIAYRPIVAKPYDSPYTKWSTFELDSGAGQMTVRGFSGRWNTKVDTEVGRHTLRCERPGISVLPHAFYRQWLQMRVSFKPTVVAQGNFILFWWEKDANKEEGHRYWRAGVYLDGGQPRLEIRKVWDDVPQLPVVNQDVSIDVDTWYSLFLSITPGQVKLIFNADDDDFSSNIATVNYYPVAADVIIGPPSQHHVGLQVLDFEGWEGALTSGTVDNATNHTLYDDASSFTSSMLGKYVRCQDQDRRIGIVAGKTLWITPPWSKVPGAGDPYGVYDASTLDGPQAEYKELFAIEGIIPWTIDDMATDVLALSGVEREDLDAIPVGTFAGDGAVLMQDVDVKVETSTDVSKIYFWCSTKTDTGSSAFGGFAVELSQQWTTLWQYVNQSEGGNEAALIAKHPNMIMLPAVGKARVVRLQVNRYFVVVSVNGHFVTAFPNKDYSHGGYVAHNDGTGTTTEFRDIVDYIWDANAQASTMLKTLLQGKRAKIIERASGKVVISRFDPDSLGDLGTYTAPVVKLVKGELGEYSTSLFEVVGETETAFFLDVEAARKALRYRRQDNPTLITQDQAHDEARRSAEQERQRLTTLVPTLYAPDPAAELEDEFVVEGVTYRVDGIAISLSQTKQGPRFEAEIRARAAPTTPDVVLYDDEFYYDSGVKYG